MEEKQKINFSFLKMMNSVKGINKPFKEDEYNADWLEKDANPVQKKNWNEYLNYYKEVGVEHPKVKYPVMFGKGDNQYPGVLALDDIKKGDVIFKVPGSEIINTKKAFFSDINHIFYDNPEVFGKNVHDGEDMMLHAFILREIQKGKESKYYNMIKMWPKDADILLNWDDEELEELQDHTLM